MIRKPEPMSNNKTSIEDHIANLDALKAPSGLFLASAQNVSTGYNKAWLRDNFYMSLAYEAVEDWDTVRSMCRAILDLFLVHKDKIQWAAENKPLESWQYIHARFHPETFEEYWEEWGNKQNDAIGALLFKFAELEERGIKVVETEDDRWILQKLVEYLNSLEYWQDPDNGVWEENEEVHASSVGAILAALIKLKEMGICTIPEGMIEKGQETLDMLLPRESETKFTDLALLSLIYPYNVVSDTQADAILKNLEYHLERNLGIIRYKNDAYYNNNKDMVSEEAEWTFGFPWLSIIYARRGDVDTAQKYFKKAQLTITGEGKIPELYYSNTESHNENNPLGWSESMYIVAYKELESRDMLPE